MSKLDAVRLTLFDVEDAVGVKSKLVIPGLKTTDGNEPVYRSAWLRREDGVWLADITLEVEPNVACSAVGDDAREVVVEIVGDGAIVRQSKAITIDGEPANVYSVTCEPGVRRVQGERLQPPVVSAPERVELGVAPASDAATGERA